MKDSYLFTILKDYEWGEDGCVTTLYDVNDAPKTEVMSGDWYHDKIDDKINGFFACLDYFGIKYVIEKEEVNKNW